MEAQLSSLYASDPGSAEQLVVPKISFTTATPPGSPPPDLLGLLSPGVAEEGVFVMDGVDAEDKFEDELKDAEAAIEAIQMTGGSMTG